MILFLEIAFSLLLSTSALAEEPAQISASVDPRKALEEALQLRDPFKRNPGLMGVTQTIVAELERFPAEQFKLIGVITGAARLRAIIQDPDGKTHFVSERMRLGNRRGIIREIRRESIIVREKIVNAVGGEEVSDNEIRLTDEKITNKGSSG